MRTAKAARVEWKTTTHRRDGETLAHSTPGAHSVAAPVRGAQRTATSFRGPGLLLGPGRAIGALGVLLPVLATGILRADSGFEGELAGDQLLLAREPRGEEEQRQAETLGRFTVAWNAADPLSIAALFDLDAGRVGSLLHPYVGREAVAAYFGKLLAGDLRGTHLQMGFFDSDRGRVSARFALRAQGTNELLRSGEIHLLMVPDGPGWAIRRLWDGVFERGPEAEPRVRRAVGREPRKLRGAMPTYPRLASRAHVRGTVILECWVDEEGRIADVEVVQGVPLLTQTAVQAVWEWRYEPLVVDGHAWPAFITVSVTFDQQ